MILTYNTLITTQYKVVLPNTLNNHDTLFGGTAMQWMDEVAYIEATRYAKKKMVTVSTDNIKFLKPIKPGEIVEIVAKIIKESAFKLYIQVEIFIEDLYSEINEKAITSVFTFAAINEENKPIRIKEGFLENV
jgi:acyl-CoA hydrolase